MHPGTSPCSATRTCWSTPGSPVTSTTHSTSTRGPTSTSTWRAATRQRSCREPPDDTMRRPRALTHLALAAMVAAVAAAAPAAAQKWADPGKVLRVTVPIAETGFDPQATSDLYSGHVQRAIFEPLYAYDYLARPYRLVPNTAAALPEISPDGRTWTIRIRPGIFFADDPAFKGRKRELTAHDYVFAWKRLLDPRMRSPYLWYLDGKLAGAERVLAAAKNAGKLDYDAEIEGLRALD